MSEINPLETIPNMTTGIESIKSTTLSGVVAGIIAAVAEIGGQYLIGYRLIEKPKLDAEAQAHSNLLIQNLHTTCRAVALDARTWRIGCSTENRGTYSASVGIQDIVVANNVSPDRHNYRAGTGGFHLAFEDDRRSYQAIPTSTRALAVYLKFDKATYPNGVNRADLDAQVTMSYQTLPDVSSGVEAANSLKDTDVRSKAHNGELVEPYLAM
ncbi:hypothetical protein [Paraburkholderia sp. PGU19]|uniref:hypothetical protein n=1 Tax=Paraburkholderia sp. PGU19 TaxID=2735434 RepID=UPI0015DB3048|nr:hypothetical protein [Paraburkholderia sp. PGU19]